MARTVMGRRGGGDTEVQEFVRRDLRLLLAQKRKSAIVEAYAGASPAGKRLIESAVGEIDPAGLESLRAGTQKPCSAKRIAYHSK